MTSQRPVHQCTWSNPQHLAWQHLSLQLLTSLITPHNTVWLLWQQLATPHYTLQFTLPAPHNTSQYLTTLVLVCNWGDVLNKTVCISNFYSFSHILPSHLTAHNTSHYLTKPNDTLQHLSAPCNTSQYLATPHNTSQNLTTLVLVCKIGVTYFPIIVGVGLNTDQKIISFSLSFYGLRI